MDDEDDDDEKLYFKYKTLKYLPQIFSPPIYHRLNIFTGRQGNIVVLYLENSCQKR
jgi:hypothetical protein